MEFLSFIDQSHSFNSRPTDMACADYFEIIIFWKKQFVKNGRFTSFLFVGSRN